MDAFHKFSIDLSPIAFTRFKMQLLIWLTGTETGDLDEIRATLSLPALSAGTNHDGSFQRKFIYLLQRSFWKRAERPRPVVFLLIIMLILVTRLEDNPEFVDNRLVISDEIKMLLALENPLARLIALRILLLKLKSRRRQRKI